MSHRIFKYKGDVRYLLIWERVNKRCEFIDVVIDSGDCITIKVLRYTEYQKKYEDNEEYNIIGVSPVREGKSHNFTTHTFMHWEAMTVYSVDGDEYITYGGGKDVPFISIDENGVVSINEYFDAFHMIDTINENIRNNYY